MSHGLILVGPFRKIGLDSRVEVKLSCLLKQHHRRGGKHFGYRCQLKGMMVTESLLLPEVSHTRTPFVHRRSFVGNHHTAVKRLSFQNGIQVLRDLIRNHGSDCIDLVHLPEGSRRPIMYIGRGKGKMVRKKESQKDPCSSMQSHGIHHIHFNLFQTTQTIFLRAHQGLDDSGNVTYLRNPK